VLTVCGGGCAVGSSNLDHRSFEINDEVIPRHPRAGMARRFEEIIDHDAKACVELELDA
jgi:phosphatidylserine/phosphatidylglycerophosphate/cardiolipin synthase-like enzyme